MRVLHTLQPGSIHPAPACPACLKPFAKRCLSKGASLLRSAAAAGAGGTSEGPSNNEAAAAAAAAGDGRPGPFAWLRRAFGGGKPDRAKLLAEYGLGAFAAYGILSNLNAGVLVTLAWLAVVRQTGQTPIDPGRWPTFLGIYAGLYLTTNLLRPVRLTAALAVAPFFNSGLTRIERTLRVNRAVAFGIMLAVIAVTSFTCITSAIIVCGGFPNGVPWKR